MKISNKEVLKVAKLAHLDLDKESIDNFAKQIGTILEHVDTLNKVDTSDVVPTYQAVFQTNVFGKDTEKESCLSIRVSFTSHHLGKFLHWKAGIKFIW